MKLAEVRHSASVTLGVCAVKLGAEENSARWQGNWEAAAPAGQGDVWCFTGSDGSLWEDGHAC